MPTRLTSALLLSLVLITSACSSSMKKPDIKKNPHPRMHYKITMTIDGAPGPFDSVTAFVQYKVANDRCVPLQPISGATLAPEESVPLDLIKVSDKIYTAQFYVDLLQDEDYYGMGVCHWEVVAATAVLQVKKVGFSPDLSKADVLAQKPGTRYFLERDYFDARAGKENMFPSDPGESSPSAYKAEFQEHLFLVTLVAKESFP